MVNKLIGDAISFDISAASSSHSLWARSVQGWAGHRSRFEVMFVTTEKCKHRPRCGCYIGKYRLIHLGQFSKP
ncbi:hypothetical protein J6590_051413 [Homalodisca vitripennis]|nr:hypothetical protein J6590_051413 [Homalodisca vitripennis]